MSECKIKMNVYRDGDQVTVKDFYLSDDLRGRVMLKNRSKVGLYSLSYPQYSGNFLHVAGDNKEEDGCVVRNVLSSPLEAHIICQQIKEMVDEINGFERKILQHIEVIRCGGDLFKLELCRHRNIISIFILHQDLEKVPRGMYERSSKGILFKSRNIPALGLEDVFLKGRYTDRDQDIYTRNFNDEQQAIDILTKVKTAANHINGITAETLPYHKRYL